jgi:3-oxoacid CoA-transferase A subunit
MTDLFARAGLERPVLNADQAVSAIADGATVMVGGFGGAGFPVALRDALARRKPRSLEIICINADFGGLADEGILVRLVCSYPTGPTSQPVVDGVEAGRIELLLTPQGTLVERIRAGGAGLGGVLTPTGLGTEFESGHEVVEIEGRRYLLALALRADVALIRAAVADRAGNLVMRLAARNFNPLMAMAARRTIVEVDRIVEIGELEPEQIHVPSVFVDALVQATDGARRLRRDPAASRAAGGAACPGGGNVPVGGGS